MRAKLVLTSARFAAQPELRPLIRLLTEDAMRYVTLGLLSLLVIGMIGCGGKEKKVVEDRKRQLPPPGTAEKFLLKEEPKGAKDVIAVRKDAKHDDSILVVGRIGGSENPWIKDRAAFSIVDLSLKACSDIEGDNCPAPWDYCCELKKLPTSKVFVKFQDDKGKTIRWDARTLFQVRELQTVVVKAKAKRDKEGNLVLIGEAIFPGSTDPPKPKKKT